MIQHSINPVLLNLGPLDIRWYGVIYVLGFIIGYLFLRNAASKKRIKNLTPERAENLILWILLGVIIGARFFEVVVYNLPFYLHNPERILMVWTGGLSFHGGLLGAIAGSWLYLRKHKIPFYPVADLMVIPAAIGLGLGRIANFINGELPGTLSNLPWCVKYQNVEGCRHPVVLYESLKNFFNAGVLWILYNHRKSLPAGFIFWSFWVLYGILRFTITFLREDPRWLGISLGQWMCLVMILVGSIMLFRLWNRRKA